MKSFLFYLLFIAVLFTSCSDDFTIKSLTLRPVKMTEADTGRELVYDEQNRLSKVIMTTVLPNNETIRNESQFHYGDDSNLDSCVTDTGYKMIYQYANGRIVQTDEFINNVFNQYHTFQYSSDGRRIVELSSWKNIEEAGGFVAHTRNTFEYDANRNLQKSGLYNYNTATNEHELSTTYEFSEYDTKKSGDDLFDVMPIHPWITFRSNNPGKLEIKNNLGNLSSVEIYTYVYNDMEYPEKRNTAVTYLHNGSSGSYETEYFYVKK